MRQNPLCRAVLARYFCVNQIKTNENQARRKRAGDRRVFSHHLPTRNRPAIHCGKAQLPFRGGQHFATRNGQAASLSGFDQSIKVSQSKIEAMSEKTTPIYAAMTAIMADCGAIAKGRKNQQQGYNFRSIDDLYNAIHPLFAKHGVFVTSEVLDRHREERTTQRGGVLIYTILRVKFTFYASDGSSVASITEGESMDSADKSTNKAMSAALKYCLMQMLLIPTEELQDADATTPQPAPKQQPKPAKAKEPLTPESPIWPKAVEAIADGKYTLEQVAAAKAITKEHLEQLRLEAEHLAAEIELSNQNNQ